MKKRSFPKIAILFSILVCIGTLYAQPNLSVTSAVGQNPTNLINARLAGDGVILSNGTFNGSAGNITHPQIGTFNRNNFTTFPFASGLIMTTGNVSVAPGPNSGGGTSAAVSNYYTDNLSQMQALGNITSCAVLDFDFVAFADNFAFEYVFGSEEYEEYVGSQFNDVFAFFLTGIDPVTLQNTTKNIALIPNTVQPVSINNVNHQQHTNYYISNPSGNTGIQYDGYTTALTASANILACQTYHMHLSICNVGDQGWDSGVFLKEGSFYSPTIETGSEWNMPDYGDTLIQNCRDVDIKFTTEDSMQTGYSIYMNFGGTAINGTDYTLTLDDDTRIDNNNNNFGYQNTTEVNTHLSILPTADFSTTDIKTVIIYIEKAFCEFIEDGIQRDTLIFYLKKNEAIAFASDTVTINACHLCEHLAVELESGTDPLLYQWIPATGLNDPESLETDANITENKTYTVIARDRYGCLADTAIVKVLIQEQPTAAPVVTPDFGCAPLTVSLSQANIPENSLIAWQLTNEELVIDADSTAHALVTLTEPGYYTLYEWMSSAPGCNDSILIERKIHVSNYPTAEFTFAPEEPQNGQEVNFYNNSTGDDITNFTWSFGDGSVSSESDPVHAYHLLNSENMTVRFVVSNRDGCSDTTSAVVPVVDNFAFWVPNSFTPNNDGKNDIFLPRVTDVIFYQFDVFSRNGELIFTTHNTEQGWDGTMNGKQAPMGVYVWKIQYAKYGTPNKTIMKTGNITLVR